MMSLFSPFDIRLFFIPLVFLVICCMLFFSFIYKSNSVLKMLKTLMLALSEFFSTLKPKNFNKASMLMFMCVFFALLLTNLFSVFPFNFPATSQISMVLMFSGSIWISLVLHSLIKNFKGYMSHMIPEGTPLPLTFLLFLIELVSSLIRPLTLTVRLVANILAGHLLMSLLSSLVFLMNLSGVFYLGLNLVEIFVSLIQAYIFTTMTVLYFSEV